MNGVSSHELNSDGVVLDVRIASSKTCGNVCLFAGSPGAYPTETHFRGLVGHLVLGGTTDVLADIL